MYKNETVGCAVRQIHRISRTVACWPLGRPEPAWLHKKGEFWCDSAHAVHVRGLCKAYFQCSNGGTTVCGNASALGHFVRSCKCTISAGSGPPAWQLVDDGWQEAGPSSNEPYLPKACAWDSQSAACERVRRWYAHAESSEEQTDALGTRWQPLLGSVGCHSSAQRLRPTLLHDACNGVYISDALHLAYVENQKAGSSQLLAHLHAAGSVRVVLLPYRGRMRSEARSRARVHCPATNVRKLPANYILFTFVREPLSTFVSGAFELLERHWIRNASVDWGACPTQGHTALSGSHWPLRPSLDSVSTYLRQLIIDVNYSRELHPEAFHIWPQQVKTGLELGGRRLDFVGQTEQLDTDFAALVNMSTGRASVKAAVVPRDNHSNVANAARCRSCHEHAIEWLMSSPSYFGTLCELLRADVKCLPSLCSNHAVTTVSRRMM